MSQRDSRSSILVLFLCCAAIKSASFQQHVTLQVYHVRKKESYIVNFAFIYNIILVILLPCGARAAADNAIRLARATY